MISGGIDDYKRLKCNVIEIEGLLKEITLSEYKMTRLAYKTRLRNCLHPVQLIGDSSSYEPDSFKYCLSL